MIAVTTKKATAGGSEVSPRQQRRHPVLEGWPRESIRAFHPGRPRPLAAHQRTPPAEPMNRAEALPWQQALANCRAECAHLCAAKLRAAGRKRQQTSMWSSKTLKVLHRRRSKSIGNMRHLSQCCTQLRMSRDVPYASHMPSEWIRRIPYPKQSAAAPACETPGIRRPMEREKYKESAKHFSKQTHLCQAIHREYGLMEPFRICP
ncbi:hypothetical protein MRX96_020570 [Rhipicephalus microplus]